MHKAHLPNSMCKSMKLPSHASMGATAPSPRRSQTHVNAAGWTSAGLLTAARVIPQVRAGAAAPRPHTTRPEDSAERAGRGTYMANLPATSCPSAQALRERPAPAPPPAPQRGEGWGVPGVPPQFPPRLWRSRRLHRGHRHGQPRSAACAWRRWTPHGQTSALGAEKQRCSFLEAFEEEPGDGGWWDTSGSPQRDSHATTRPSWQPEDASVAGWPPQGPAGQGVLSGVGSALNPAHGMGSTGWPLPGDPPPRHSYGTARH